MRKNGKSVVSNPLQNLSFKWRFTLLTVGISIPLTAWSLGLPDYLNQSTVTASSSQFESNTANNSDSVQITPNAEIIIVKQVVNDNGGVGTLSDFAVATDAGSLVFDSGTVAGNTTTFTSSTIYVPPGTYSLSEADFNGYSEGSWSCSVGTVGSSAFDSGSVTLAFGEQTTCTIINDDDAPTLTLATTIVNDDGGNLADTNFSASIDAVAVGNGVATPVAANTAITISELDLDGYTEGTWACTDATGLTTGLPTVGVATGESITLQSGSDVTCTITNDDIAPTLTLAKTLINDHGGNLTIEDFDISVDGTEVISGTANTVLANTSIVISELDIPGYEEGNWACTDANSLTSGLPVAGAATGESITLASGADVTCAISNDDVQPVLTLAKILINDNGGSNTISDFGLSIDGSLVSSGIANNVLANTAITISELDLPGYTEGTWACADANGLTTSLPTAGLATGESISLRPGSDVTCSITNDDIAPILTLVKNLTNDNGGAMTIADFDISIDSVEVVSGASNIVAANTNIVISELDLDGYSAGAWSCVDSTGLTATLPSAGLATGETISLAEGAVVSCEISNDDIAPTLTLISTVVNDNGGNLATSDFDISIDGTEVISGAANTVLANTTINVSELDLAPYSEGTWSCTDANGFTTGLPSTGLATGTDISLLPGSDVTCGITNNDLGIDLTIAKTVDDSTPNIGQTISFSLVVNNAGPDIATNVTVGDLVPAGFTYVAASIGGGDASDDLDPAGSGLSWTINTIPVGSPVTLTFDAVVNAP